MFDVGVAATVMLEHPALRAKGDIPIVLGREVVVVGDVADREQHVARSLVLRLRGLGSPEAAGQCDDQRCDDRKRRRANPFLHVCAIQNSSPFS